MKKNFTEPEMEVVRFNAQEALIATSGCGVGDDCETDCAFDNFCTTDVY